MSTQYMKLGFVDQVIKDDGFYNIKINGRTVGVNIDLGFNYYRGISLSCIETFKVFIDGKEVPEDLMLFWLNGKGFRIGQLKDLYAEFWGIKQRAHVQIFNGGLSTGEHTIEVQMYLRCAYMQFAPGVYGMIDSSCKKTLNLKEAVEYGERY